MYPHLRGSRVVKQLREGLVEPQYPVNQVFRKIEDSIRSWDHCRAGNPSCLASVPVITGQLGTPSTQPWPKFHQREELAPPFVSAENKRNVVKTQPSTPPSDIAESEEIWQQLTEREHQTCSSLSNDIGAKWLLTCRREDPEISECIRRLFEHMFPALAVGIPEIGVKRFEPLYIKKLALTKGHGAVVISGSFTDILAHGPSNATTKYALFDLKNRIFELGIDIPEILVESEYDLSGKILILPLVGSGEARLRLCQYIRCQFWLSVSIAQWIGRT
uniref:(California timema) hypothetical protein n=1 Tax=Timema californicum TaxID=61474 RepID=A0A7R9JID5_TIMCA|nr:unnamed protein product [Timema californicum]